MRSSLSQILRGYGSGEDNIRRFKERLRDFEADSSLTQQFLRELPLIIDDIFGQFTERSAGGQTHLLEIFGVESPFWRILTKRANVVLTFFNHTLPAHVRQQFADATDAEEAAKAATDPNTQTPNLSQAQGGPDVYGSSATGGPAYPPLVQPLPALIGAHRAHVVRKVPSSNTAAARGAPPPDVEVTIRLSPVEFVLFSIAGQISPLQAAAAGASRRAPGRLLDDSWMSDSEVILWELLVVRTLHVCRRLDSDSLAAHAAPQRLTSLFVQLLIDYCIVPLVPAFVTPVDSGHIRTALPFLRQQLGPPQAALEALRLSQQQQQQSAQVGQGQGRAMAGQVDGYGSPLGDRGGARLLSASGSRYGNAGGVSSPATPRFGATQQQSLQTDHMRTLPSPRQALPPFQMMHSPLTPAPAGVSPMRVRAPVTPPSFAGGAAMRSPAVRGLQQGPGGWGPSAGGLGPLTPRERDRQTYGVTAAHLRGPGGLVGGQAVCWWEEIFPFLRPRTEAPLEVTRTSLRCLSAALACLLAEKEKELIGAHRASSQQQSVEADRGLSLGIDRDSRRTGGGPRPGGGGGGGPITPLSEELAQLIPALVQLIASLVFVPSGRDAAVSRADTPGTSRGGFPSSLRGHHGGHLLLRMEGGGGGVGPAGAVGGRWGRNLSLGAYLEVFRLSLLLCFPQTAGVRCEKLFALSCRYPPLPLPALRSIPLPPFIDNSYAFGGGAQSGTVLRRLSGSTGVTPPPPRSVIGGRPVMASPLAQRRHSPPSSGELTGGVAALPWDAFIRAFAADRRAHPWDPILGGRYPKLILEAVTAASSENEKGAGAVVPGQPASLSPLQGGRRMGSSGGGTGDAGGRGGFDVVGLPSPWQKYLDMVSVSFRLLVEILMHPLADEIPGALQQEGVAHPDRDRGDGLLGFVSSHNVHWQTPQYGGGGGGYGYGGLGGETRRREVAESRCAHQFVELYLEALSGLVDSDVQRVIGSVMQSSAARSQRERLIAATQMQSVRRLPQSQATQQMSLAVAAASFPPPQSVLAFLVRMEGEAELEGHASSMPSGDMQMQMNAYSRGVMLHGQEPHGGGMHGGSTGGGGAASGYHHGGVSVVNRLAVAPLLPRDEGAGRGGGGWYGSADGVVEGELMEFDGASGFLIRELAEDPFVFKPSQIPNELFAQTLSTVWSILREQSVRLEQRGVERMQNSMELISAAAAKGAFGPKLFPPPRHAKPGLISGLTQAFTGGGREREKDRQATPEISQAAVQPAAAGVPAGSSVSPQEQDKDKDTLRQRAAARPSPQAEHDPASRQVDPWIPQQPTQPQASPTAPQDATVASATEGAHPPAPPAVSAGDAGAVGVTAPSLNPTLAQSLQSHLKPVVQKGVVSLQWGVTRAFESAKTLAASLSSRQRVQTSAQAVEVRGETGAGEVQQQQQPPGTPQPSSAVQPQGGQQVYDRFTEEDRARERERRERERQRDIKSVWRRPPRGYEVRWMLPFSVWLAIQIDLLFSFLGSLFEAAVRRVRGGRRAAAAAPPRTPQGPVPTTGGTPDRSHASSRTPPLVTPGGGRFASSRLDPFSPPPPRFVMERGVESHGLPRNQWVRRVADHRVWLWVAIFHFMGIFVFLRSKGGVERLCGILPGSLCVVACGLYVASSVFSFLVGFRYI